MDIKIRKLSPLIPEQVYAHDEMLNKVSAEQLKVISFDIFDTLILRPFLYPTDLFFLLEKDFQMLYTGKKSFSQLRVEAESNARKSNEYHEPNLDEIYNEFQKISEITSSSCEKLKEREIELEIYFCYPRESGVELLKEALKNKKTVILSSDMYLPKNIIEKMLKKCGITEYNSLFVSNSIHKNKCSGEMYNHILSQLKIENFELLHIGDNIQSDIEKPSMLGIPSLYLPSCRELLFKSGRLCGYIYTQLGKEINSDKYFVLRCLMALYSSYAFDYPFTKEKNGDFYKNDYFMGFLILGGLEIYDEFVISNEIEALILNALKQHQNCVNGLNDFKQVYQNHFGDLLNKYQHIGCSLPFMFILNHADINDRQFFIDCYSALDYEKWNSYITEAVIIGDISNISKSKKKRIIDLFFPENSWQKKFLKKILKR